MSETFSVKKRCMSFYYAVRGIFTLLRSQHNAWIHLFATILVIGLGIFFHVTTLDWIFLVMAIAMVWVAEGVNTSIEFLCNQVSTDHHPLIEKSKDVAAGAVLIAAIAAAIIGLFVFIPYFARR